MRLRQPTDFQILEALHTYGRNVAPNLAPVTGKSRKNINSRLPMLEDYDLVQKVGPAENSGVYEITARGEAALALRDQYGKVDDFEAAIERRVESASSTPTRATARNEERVDDEGE